jgi:two-component system sensor histidine kinase PhcS
VNLISNALDALKKKKFENEQPSIRILTEERDHSVYLRIRDNGMGIAPENMSKIFDPFFTTKDVGEGMGLGLSICYRIVQECGGKIFARSEPGKFCEFTLEFPKKPETKTVTADA